MTFHFLWPWVFLLWLFPVMLFFKGVASHGWALRFSSMPMAGTVSLREGRRQGRWSLFFGLSLMVIALARPQWGEFSEGQRVRHLMLALDVSGSMRTLEPQQGGAPISRLRHLKRHVDDFLQQATNNRVGIVLFADKAYTLSPLTTDLVLLSQLLAHVQTGMVGEKTAMGDAIVLAIARLQALKGVSAGSKAVIVFTDGQQTVRGVPLQQAFLLAQSEGIKVYPIVIESLRSPEANKQWQMYTAQLDEMVLNAGGKSFYLERISTLGEVFDAINRLQRVAIKHRASMLWKELYLYPLLMGLLMIFWCSCYRKFFIME